MINNLNNDFGIEDTYKLFRTVYEIIHPTISKKNISNYRIVIKEDLIPLRIFYPKKISKMDRVIIYVRGSRWIINNSISYTDICQEIVNKTDTLVIALDYEIVDMGYNKIVFDVFKTINYLYKELIKVGFLSDNIILMGDSTGASILSSLSRKNVNIKKQILLYPVLNLIIDPINIKSLKKDTKVNNMILNNLKIYMNKYINEQKYFNPLNNKDYNNWPTTLIITGDLDPSRDDGCKLAQQLRSQNKKNKYINIEFATHGFLHSKDLEAKEECFNEINKFIRK